MKKTFIAIASICLALATSISGALADPFGTNGPNTGPFADNSLHNYCFVGTMESYWVNPLTLAMTNLDNQSQMTIGTQYSCNSDADIRFSKVDSSILLGILGSYRCTSWTQVYGVCAGSSIQLNSDLLTSTSFRQKTACHEIGHSVGLTHGASYGGCMISGFSTINFYSSHHISHINSHY